MVQADERRSADMRLIQQPHSRSAATRDGQSPSAACLVVAACLLAAVSSANPSAARAQAAGKPSPAAPPSEDAIKQREQELEAARQQQKSAADDPKVAGGKAVFDSLSCVNCHVVKGTAAIGKFGPDLTHLMSRQTLGAGVVTNTAQNLRAWVNDPQEVKPGCLMPSMKLTDSQLDQVLAYLESLN